jgi:voltage-gated potassium channel Kch
MVLPITFQPALLIPVADLNAIFPQNLTHEGKGWNVIGSTILDSLRIASYVDDVMSTGATVTTTAFKTIGSTTGRALHVAGGVFGILLLPIDIHTLVASSIDVHKTNPHKNQHS